MRVALDTNVLAYAEGVGDATRCTGAIALVEQLPAESVLIPAQTLGELFRVLTGKADRAPGLAREALMTWADCFEVADSTWTAFQAAADLVVDHRLQIWDALIMAVAAENHTAGCF
ncbi:MAG: PIN domain-containing protein [Desulfobacterales bacterium]|nr:PIN domain-containing protein [Desulfobacterales bacterium]